MGSNRDSTNHTSVRVRSESVGPTDPFTHSDTAESRQLLADGLNERKAIARNIAQDGNLSVTLGEEGCGSYCQYGGPAGTRVDRVSRSIVIDPQHLLDEANKFIIAHEGMHAFVTRSPFDRAVNSALKHICKPEELYSEVGFASLLNYLEDCGGNSWLTKNYPAFKAPAQKLYDSMLNEENPQMHTGETKAVMARLGFFPRFAQFGSEVMKRWHTGAYSKTLDPAVEKALATQQANADSFIAAFPDGQYSEAQELDKLFCKRFFIAANKIMPTIRALVEDDKAQAAMQQFLNQHNKNNPFTGQQSQQQPGIEQQGQQQQGQQKRGASQRGGQPQGSEHMGQEQSGSGQQPGGQGSSGQGFGSQRSASKKALQPQSSGNPSSGGSPQPGDGVPPTSANTLGGAHNTGGSELSPDVQREINQKTATHRDALRNQLKDELDQLSKHLDSPNQSGSGQASASQTSASQNEQARQEGVASAPTHDELAKQIEDLKKRIDEKFDGAQDKDAKKEVEKHLESLEELNESIDSQAAPLDALSEQAQQELKELYDRQTAQDKKQWEEVGEEILKDFEDAIREMLEGKLQETPAQTHREVREAKEAAKRAAQVYKEADEITKRLEELRRSKLSLWDIAREEVAQLIGKLYTRLERVLRPSVPEWDTGYATGNRINTTSAMQAEADPKLAAKMWEQRSLPIEREFVFSLLVDNSLSMSMDSSDKYLHARRCSVLLSEVLTQLKVPFEITIFSDSSQVLRSFSDKPSKEKKNQIGSAINGKGGGTQDYKAVRERVAALSSRSEENKFLIVITDGGSNNSTELKNTLANALSRGIRVIGLGVGGDTADVDKYYPIGRGGLSVDPNDKEAALGPYFAKLLEEILKNPEQFVTKALRDKSKQKEESEEG